MRSNCCQILVGLWSREHGSYRVLLASRYCGSAGKKCNQLCQSSNGPWGSAFCYGTTSIVIERWRRMTAFCGWETLCNIVACVDHNQRRTLTCTEVASLGQR